MVKRGLQQSGATYWHHPSERLERCCGSSVLPSTCRPVGKRCQLEVSTIIDLSVMLGTLQLLLPSLQHYAPLLCLIFRVVQRKRVDKRLPSLNKIDNKIHEKNKHWRRQRWFERRFVSMKIQISCTVQWLVSACPDLLLQSATHCRYLQARNSSDVYNVDRVWDKML